jgi:hypothetical protein
VNLDGISLAIVLLGAIDDDINGIIKPCNSMIRDSTVPSGAPSNRQVLLLECPRCRRRGSPIDDFIHHDAGAQGRRETRHGCLLKG